MQNIAKILNNVMRTCCSEQLILHMRILENWEYITGPNLSSFSSLNTLKNPVVIVNAVNSIATLLKAEEQNILNRMNSMTNGTVFNKLIIKHCLNIGHQDAA